MRDFCSVLDTLALARQMHPGQRNSLDALCKRYSVDNSHRDLHGALLDADLLLEVYLAMTGGQGALTLDDRAAASECRHCGVASRASRRACCWCAAPRPTSCWRTNNCCVVLDKASRGKTAWRKLEPVRRQSSGVRCGACMTFTLSQAFGRAFMGQAPEWYKLTVIAFLVANPILLLLFGPVVTGWAVLAEFIFTLAHGVALLSVATRRPAGDRGGRDRADDARKRLRGSACRRSRSSCC